MAGVPTRFQDKNVVVTQGIIDLINGVIEDFDTNAVEQTARLTQHPVMRRMMQGASTTSGGPIRSDVVVREKQGFKWTSLMEPRQTSRQDLIVKLTSEPVHSDDGYHMDIREEAFTSGNAEKIYDHLEVQDSAMVKSMWDNWENALVTMPSTPGAYEPFGLSAFLRTLAIGEESDGAFNGITAYYQDGTSTTNIQGQDASLPDNAALRNYAATYNGNFDEGLIGIITRAKLATMFSFVPGVKQKNGSVAGGNIGFVPTEIFAQALEFADKVTGYGPDARIAREYDEVTVRGCVLVHTPALDRFSFAPMYFVNQQKLKGKRLKNFFLRRLGPNVRPNTNGLGMEVAIATSGCMHCSNPRHAGFAIHKKRVA
jgi:hypothetical protein